MRYLLAAAIAGIAIASHASDSIDYTPKIHGTFRGRYELSTTKGEQRFQVRNTRVSISGNISKGIDYFAQADLCDRGKMKILDAWGRLTFTPSLTLRAGQFRMPFGVETFRAPNNYYFANRSFMGKQMCNYRAVGAQFAYKFRSIPLQLEAGAFNPNTISDHDNWHKPMAYSGKATYKLGNTSLSAGFMSIEPDSVRTNLIDGAIGWNAGRWTVNGEYMYEHYTNKRHKEAHSYLVMADYKMPVKLWEFNQLSFQGRFDGMTAHSTGTRNSLGQLVTNNPARNRITIGSTISYIHSKGIYADIRANYEKYFYHKGVDVTADMGDKFVVELVVRF